MAKRAKTADVAKVPKRSVPRREAGTLRSPAKVNGPASDVGDEGSREGIRLGFLIHDVSRMRRAAYDQFMKPLGITRAQWWVLAHLSRHDGMMQTQLADVLDVGKASLGDVIESLESRGWVERRSDASDKRAKRVFLAKPAHSMLKRMTSMENNFNSQILGELNEAERNELVNGLQKIKRGLSRFHRSPVAAE